MLYRLDDLRVQLNGDGHFIADNATVIGDVVNTAARIEGLTKELGTSVLLSETTAAATERPTRCIGRFSLRGKGRAVALYQLLDDLDPAERACVDAGRSQFDPIHGQQDENDPATYLLRLSDYVESHPLDRVAHALLARAGSPVAGG